MNRAGDRESDPTGVGVESAPGRAAVTLDTEVATGGVPVPVSPEREVRFFLRDSVVLPGEIATGGSDGVTAIGDDLSSRGERVGAVELDAFDGGFPYVPGFDGGRERDGVVEVRGEKFFEFPCCAGMGFGATDNDPVVYNFLGGGDNV